MLSNLFAIRMVDALSKSITGDTFGFVDVSVILVSKDLTELISFASLILDATILKLKSGEQITIEDLNLDKQLLEKINKFAPIKHILKNKPNNDNQVIELLDDISKDLFNYDLELRIQELESKFSKDMSETTFNELKELKNERKIN